MGPIMRITTTYLVEVNDSDIKNIKKFGLDEFILGDMRTKRKLVVSGPLIPRSIVIFESNES